MATVKYQVNKIFDEIITLKDLDNAKRKIDNIIARLSLENRTIPVRYIGPKPTFTDHTYGSGLTWHSGEALPVRATIAEKLLRHYDVYQKADKVSRYLEPKEMTPEKVEDVNRKQEARDAVSRMDNIATIRMFIHDNFAGSVLPKKLVDIEKAREKAIILIDTVELP